MRTTLSAGLALALMTGLLTSPAHAQQRADGWVEVDPDPVPIYGDITAEMRPVNGSGYNYVFLTDPDQDGVYAGRRKVDAFDSSSSRWRIETSATAADGSGDLQGPAAYFSFKGVTKLKAKATPKKGRTFVLSGTFTGVARFGGWTTYPKKPVNLYFRKSGTTRWVYSGQVKTNDDGKFTKTFRPKKSGSWKAVYPGSARYLESSSKTIRVTVR